MIINGQRYEAEPAVEAYVKDLQAENEEQRREILRLTDALKEMDGANEYLRNQSAKDFENVLKFMDTIGALKKENAQLEEKYQKATGVIAATDCAECKRYDSDINRAINVIRRFCEGQERCKNCPIYTGDFNNPCIFRYHLAPAHWGNVELETNDGGADNETD